jgi:hypothetical protein
MRIKASIVIEPPTPCGTYPNDQLVVVGTWQGCTADSDYGMGWNLGEPSKKTRALADRLVAAIDAGVVFGEPVEKTNVHGETYISASTSVMGRGLNASLRRLGF